VERCTWKAIRRQYVEPLLVLVERIGVECGDFPGRPTLFARLRQQLIFPSVQPIDAKVTDIGDILDVMNDKVALY
jgi:hypothetical protein